MPKQSQKSKKPKKAPPPEESDLDIPTGTSTEEREEFETPAVTVTEEDESEEDEEDEESEEDEAEVHSKKAATPSRRKRKPKPKPEGSTRPRGRAASPSGVTEEQSAQLVVWLEANSVLWDTTHDENQNTTTKEKLWADQAAEMGLQRKQLTKWYCTKRSTFTRAHRKTLQGRKLTRNEGKVYQELPFLKPFVWHHGSQTRSSSQPLDVNQPPAPSSPAPSSPAPQTPACTPAARPSKRDRRHGFGQYLRSTISSIPDEDWSEYEDEAWALVHRYMRRARARERREANTTTAMATITTTTAANTTTAMATITTTTAATTTAAEGLTIVSITPATPEPQPSTSAMPAARSSRSLSDPFPLQATFYQQQEHYYHYTIPQQQPQQQQQQPQQQQFSFLSALQLAESPEQQDIAQADVGAAAEANAAGEAEAQAEAEASSSEHGNWPVKTALLRANTLFKTALLRATHMFPEESGDSWC